MADEPVIDEAVEQDAAPAEAPQVEAAAEDVSTDNVLTDAPDDVVDAEPESMPDEPVETVVETPTPPDLTSVDLDALREARPDLLEVVANAERQRTMAELRKQAGEQERTRQLAEQQMRKLNVDPASVEDPSAWYLMAENNRAYEHDQVMRAVAQNVAENLGFNEAQRQGFDQLIESSSGDDLTNYAGKLFLDAVEARAVAKAGELSLEDFPEGSKVRADHEAAVAAARAAEREAAGIAGKTPKAPAPRASAGNPVGTTEQHDLNSLIGISRAWRAGEITEAKAQELTQKAKRQPSRV